MTVTVKAGDSLSGIASAHKLTLKALLAFVENAKYRAKPGLIHPGDIVREVVDSQPGTILGREPAMLLALVQAVIALVAAFGLIPRTRPDGAILPVTAAALGLITRSRASPASATPE